MQFLTEGKTKTLYDAGNGQLCIVFKDDVTGSAEGIDPGGNKVVGRETGKGMAALRQATHFFQLLERHGIPTHYIETDLDRGAIFAHKATWFGLEFIVRFQAYGSFIKRYGQYVSEGQALDGLVEITLKDDEREDPLIGDDAIAALRILTQGQVTEAKRLVHRAANIIREHLQAHDLDLVDIKFECGIVADRIVIIDDISTDNMRVKHNEQFVNAQQLLSILKI